MSSDVMAYSIKAPDDLWRKHKAVWDACKAVDIDPPEETERYFEDMEPDPEGVRTDLGSVGGEPSHPSTTTYSKPYESGLLIDISKLPRSTTHIRIAWM